MELCSYHRPNATKLIYRKKDDFDTEVLRRLVHDFYREKMFLTLDFLLVARVI